jgi:hypothetical protein
LLSPFFDGKTTIFRMAKPAVDFPSNPTCASGAAGCVAALSGSGEAMGLGGVSWWGFTQQMGISWRFHGDFLNI